MTVTSHVELASNSPAADLALLTDAELAEAAEGMPGAEDSPVGTLANLGLAAAEWIATLCGIAGIDGNPPTLKQEDLIETFRIVGNGPKSLVLSRRFVSSVTITEDGTALTEGTDFVVSGDAGIVRRLSSDDVIRWATGTTVVNYTAGFATVPAIIKEVAKDYVRMRLSSRDRDPFERSMSAEGIGSLSFREGGDSEGSFAQAARERLARFITPVLG